LECKPGTIIDAVAGELQQCLADLPAGIARAASVQLTRRVHDRARGRGTPVGNHHLDGLVKAILDGKAASGWQQARHSWRDTMVQELETRVRDLDVASVASSAVKDVLATMTVDEMLATMFSAHHPTRVTMSGSAGHDLANVLRERALAGAWKCIGAAAWDMVTPVVNAMLEGMIKEPGRHVLLPRCTKQVIPLAIDDGQVYRLDLDVDGTSGRVVAATVRFSLEAGVIRTFRLHGLDRIDAMLARGFLPARGTITRKRGGGLLLHLPFEKECTIDPFPGNKDAIGNGQHEPVVVAGVDLGLKHLAWLSIGACQASTAGDGSWTPMDMAHPETARHCIDLPQLVGRKEAWIAGPPALPAPNLKRKLIVLASRARALQVQKDMLRHRYRGRYKHAWQYFVVRQEWQRCWRKMRHLHEEIARQVATRIVAACKHHGVEMLRFEDLSWSRHSAKRVSGAWLASWQVHWFFSQVQEHAILLARMAGIAVELVDARGTSKRCNACNAIGVRDGKRFTCTNDGCKKIVDSDLNGSRNVRIAPTSPRPRAKGEGARYRPLACHDMTSFNRGELDHDVQLCHDFN
jgi:transposase